MPSFICVNSEVFTSHTHLVFHQVKLSTLMPLSKREVNVRLCFGEVGVDLELCVHAHGHDVDLIIKASLKLDYSFRISSSYIRDLAFCNRGSDHVLL